MDVLLGMLLTACAISTGAPFWVDLLRKVVELRGRIVPVTEPSTAAAVKPPARRGAPAARTTLRTSSTESKSLESLDGFEHDAFGFSRVSNNRDAAPRVPTLRTPDVLGRVENCDLEVYDYVHAGRVIYFNDVGRAIVDPPLWYRTLNTVPMGSSQADIAGRLRQTVGDHAIDAYVRAHMALLKTDEASA